MRGLIECINFERFDPNLSSVCRRCGVLRVRSRLQQRPMGAAMLQPFLKIDFIARWQEKWGGGLMGVILYGLFAILFGGCLLKGC